MAFIFYKEISDDKGFVDLIHYRPDLLTTERKAEGIEVDTVPVAENIPGKAPTLYINPKTHELWYEYADVESAPDDKVALLEAKLTEMKEENTQLTLALAELAAAAEQDKIETQLAIAELASLLTESGQ